MRHWITICVSLVSLAALVFSCAAFADEAAPRRETRVKAGYLLNFLKFVQWPTTTVNGPLTVCFRGARAVHDAFIKGIDKRSVGDRAIVTRRLEHMENMESCDVLYLDAKLPAVEWQALPGMMNRPMLTVSDAQGFTRNSGMIELFIEKNRLRFNINLDNAQRAGLRFSSGLLNLASRVEKSDGG